MPPASASRARVKRSGVAVCRVSSGWPARTSSPGLACMVTPATAWTGSSLRARPAPRRQAATPTARASKAVRTPSAGAVTVSVSGARGRGASGSPPWREIMSRQMSMARPSARAVRAASSSTGLPAAAHISRARATVRSTTSAGPPPASTSRDSATSRALPAVRPSGVDMSVSRARVVTPASVPRATMVEASSRAWPSSFMKAPEPTLTSRTRAPVPSAIFLDMIEEAMRGTQETVAVVSRRA